VSVSTVIVLQAKLVSAIAGHPVCVSPETLVVVSVNAY
jgi:hypothetical protein